MTNADLNGQLQTAINSRSYLTAARALDAGADPNGPVSSYGWHMLAHAISIGATQELCKLLIDRGAEVSPKDPTAHDPLAAAAAFDNLHMCKYLIERGADVNRQSSALLSALASAAYYGTTTVCQYLVEMGTDVLTENPQGQIALHFVDGAMGVEHWKRVEIAKLLVRNGASPSHRPATPPVGYVTPFQHAVKSGTPLLVQYFIHDCGEDPKQLTLDGKTMTAIAKDAEVRQVIDAAIYAEQTGQEIARSIGLDISTTSSHARTRTPAPL